MNLTNLGIGILTVLLILFIFKLVERWLIDVFVPHKTRSDGLYQGGESIKSKIRRYRAEFFDFSLYFLILHTVGFLGATVFVLAQPLNFTTFVFGIIIFYTTILVGKSARYKHI